MIREAHPKGCDVVTMAEKADRRVHVLGKTNAAANLAHNAPSHGKSGSCLRTRLGRFEREHAGAL